MSATSSTPAAEEAAAWFTRLNRPAVTARDLNAFRDWRRDAANAAAYTEIEATWRKARSLQDDPDIRAATAEAMAKPASRATVSWSPAPRTRVLGAFGATALVLAAAGGAWSLHNSAGDSYAAKVGEQRLVTLADGSRIRLNTDSRVVVRYRADRRAVELTRGEAFFEAAHNPQRPFVVTAGPAAVRALGTRFDVRRDPQAIRVTLLEGRVAVRRDDSPPTLLLPDQQLTVTAGAISAPRPADAESATGWTSGRLVFHGEPLGAALAEVNRYATAKVVLDDGGGLAQRPVTGVFDIGDTQAFVAAVDTLFGLQARRDAAGVTHLRSRTATPEG